MKLYRVTYIHNIHDHLCIICVTTAHIGDKYPDARSCLQEKSRYALCFFW